MKHPHQNEASTGQPELDPAGRAVYVCLPVTDSKILEALAAASAELPLKKESEYHITLRYVPEAYATDIAGLKRELATICGRHESFQLTLGRPGIFPNASRIVYYGVEPCRELTRIQNEIDDAARDLDCPAAEYESYNPHITLGKGKGEARSVEPVSWLVDRLEVRLSGKSDQPHKTLLSFRLADA